MNENGDLGVSHGPADPGGLAWQRFGDYDGGKPGGFVHGLPGQVGSTQGRNEMKTIMRKGIPLAATVLIGACADLALEADRVPSDMEISNHSILIRESETAQFEVVVRDQNGEIMPLPSWAPLTWELVDDPSIADISPDGTVAPKKGGESRLTVELAGLGAAARIRINPDEVALTAPLIQLTQATQTREGTVELIARRQTLVRVFMVGDETSFYGPGVRIRMFQGADEIFQQVFPPMRDRTPNEVIESELDASVNGLIPASVMRPGVRMVVELDPEGVVPLAPGSQTRYPANGSMELSMVEPQMYRQIIVPTVSNSSSNESVIAWANGLDVDHSDMWLIRSLMPIGEMELEIHEPLRVGYDLTSGNTWGGWLQDMRSMYLQEGRRGYYYGASGYAGQFPGGYVLGIGYIGFPASIGVNGADTYTHEVGHNMNLYHAPCGGAGGPDPDFPYSGGGIGVWGYDVFRKVLRNPRELKDVMTYCEPVWISDYHFERATRHRLNGDGGVLLDADAVAALGPAGEMLVVRGLVENGELVLEPAFVVNGPPALPESEGPYRVDGIGVDGQTEFSLSFSPTPMAHGGGGFVFLVPYEPEWVATLDRMVLTGPEGTDTMTRNSFPPMAVVTDPASGQIRAIYRDWDGGPLPGEGVSSVTISRGIPTGEGR